MFFAESNVRNLNLVRNFIVFITVYGHQWLHGPLFFRPVSLKIGWVNLWLLTIIRVNDVKELRWAQDHLALKHLFSGVLSVKLNLQYVIKALNAAAVLNLLQLSFLHFGKFPLAGGGAFVFNHFSLLFILNYLKIH